MSIFGDIYSIVYSKIVHGQNGPVKLYNNKRIEKSFGLAWFRYFVFVLSFGVGDEQNFEDFVDKRCVIETKPNFQAKILTFYVYLPF